MCVEMWETKLCAAEQINTRKHNLRGVPVEGTTEVAITKTQNKQDKHYVLK